MCEGNIMIINLTESVPRLNLAKIYTIGNLQAKANQIEFTFSREAIIGFATELLWMYQDISDNKRLVLSTHQLKVDPAPNQVIGFYLTPTSPVLTLKINTLTEEDKCECEGWREINIKRKNSNHYYCVREPLTEDEGLILLESYELSKRNILNIKVLNERNEDVTEDCSTIVFEINRSGLKEFATMLLVWADNYSEQEEYILPQLQTIKQGYNLGVMLTQDSISTKFRCQDLGTVSDYDERF